MRHFRLTINCITEQATVEQKNSTVPWRKWNFLGVVRDRAAALSLIDAGWPDAEGIPTQDPDEVYTLEIVQ